MSTFQTPTPQTDRVQDAWDELSPQDRVQDAWDELSPQDRDLYTIGLCANVAATLSKLRDEAGRTDRGRRLAILATDAEKTAALAKAWISLKGDPS